MIKKLKKFLLIRNLDRDSQIEDEINLLWEAVAELQILMAQKQRPAQPVFCNCDADYTGVHAAYCQSFGRNYP